MKTAMLPNKLTVIVTISRYNARKTFKKCLTFNTKAIVYDQGIVGPIMIRDCIVSTMSVCVCVLI